jgi:hypothetical protein
MIVLKKDFLAMDIAQMVLESPQPIVPLTTGSM